MDYPEGYVVKKLGGNGGPRAKWRKLKRRTKPQKPVSLIPRPVTAYVPPGRR